MKMSFEELEKMPFVELKEFFEETKDSLFTLLSKLDLNMVRVSVMALARESNYSYNHVIENDDILYQMCNLMTDLNACKYVISRRNLNV